MSKVIELNAYKQKKDNEKTIAPEEPIKSKYDLALEAMTPEEFEEMQIFLLNN